MQHRIRVRSDKRGYQAYCSCDKYFSRWQEYHGAAVQLGRVHVARAEEKERKRAEDRGSR